MKKKLTGLLLCLCAAVALLTTAALADGDTHSNHCVCGKTHADVGNHTTESQITNWTAWGETGSLPNSSGNYYLTNDVTLTSKWEPATGTVLCLNGHTITGKDGSPVIGVKSGVTFTLTDCATTSGKITHESGKNGFGVNVNGGTFNMYAGEISGNGGNYGGDCGGVYVHNEGTTGTFNLYGGSITGNKAMSYGGGVRTDNTNTFNMYGGSISDNTAYRGGGVYVKGHFNMSGGEITGNSVSYTGTDATAKACGGGVYVDSQGIFNVSGAPKVTNNTATSATNNVEINRTQLITVTGALDSAASIGVTTPTTPTDGSPQPVAQADSESGYSLTNTDKNAFTPDLGTDNYQIKLEDSQLKLYYGAAPAHTHVWDYIGSGTSGIEAKCKAADCPNPSGKVTINAPESSTLTYDGNSKEATLTDTLPAGVTAPSIKYYSVSNGNETDLGTTAPTNAGNYKAEIQLGVYGAYVTYTISPKPITVSESNITLSGNSFTYTGSPITPTVTIKDGDTIIPESEYTVTYSDNINAGPATITITNKTGGNYTVSGSTTFTIAAKTVDDLDVSVGSLTYNGGAQSPTVTITHGDRTLVENTDYTLTGDTSKTNAGTYSLTVTGTTNYSGTREGIEWSIAPKPVTISGVTATERDYAAGNTSVTLTGGTLQGVVTGDETKVGFDLSTGTMQNANAGDSKPVTTSITLTGDAKDNYTLTQPTGITVKINKLNPTYTVPTGLTATYGQTLADVSPSGHTGWSWQDATTTSVGAVGSNTFKMKFTPTDTTNYNVIENVNVSVTVSKAAYGDKTTSGSAKYGSSGEVNLSNLIVTGGTATLGTVTDDQGILSPNTTSFDGSKLHFAFVNEPNNATKTATIEVNVTSANYENYTITVTVEVLAKTPQATLIICADKTTVTYGETVTLSTTGGSGDGEVTYTVTNGAVSLVGDQLTLKCVGTVTVMATKAGDATYADVESNTIEITVNPATVTVTALDRSIYVNGTAPDLTSPVKGTDYTVTGLVGADTLTSVTMQYATTPDVTTTGSYDIEITATADAEKYTVNTVNGTLTISNRSSSGGSSKPTVTVPVSSAAGSVQVKAEVSKGTATVNVSDRQLEQVIASGSGNVTVDVSGVKNVDSVKLPANVVEKTNEAENTALTVALPDGSVTLDETALGSVAAGKDVTISVKEVPATDLTEQQQKAVGDMASIGLVVDVDVFVGGVKQSSFDGGKLTISIPYTPKSGEDTSKLTVWFIKDDGTIENKGGHYDAETGCFVFVTDHLSRYVLMYDNRPVSFTDVSADAWYAAAVNWATSKDITGGIGDGKFGPDLSCTRAQLVTFLYRAAVAQGMDVSVGEDTNILSYTDAFSIPEYAVSAFQWAVGAGIVQGYDGALMPNDDCTRGQIVTMLYRFAVTTGKDVSVGEDTNILSYSDAFEVPEYAVAPFQWATGAGIVNGSDGKLMPSDTCTRGQIVTMLYRLLGE